MTHTDRTPYCTKIRYGITGAPILDGDDMDGSHAPGVGLEPVLIELVYSAALKDRPASVAASVTGLWTRFGVREQPERTVTTHFKNGPDGWPAWLAKEARLHAPESAGVAPAADQTGQACACGGKFPLQHFHADTHEPTDQTGPSRRAGLRNEIAEGGPVL